jgi:hypothetical protein
MMNSLPFDWFGRGIFSSLFVVVLAGRGRISGIIKRLNIPIINHLLIFPFKNRCVLSYEIGN